jgi:uncharacterized protein (DUF2062 family)
MDFTPILLRKPFIIPSLIAALMVSLRIFFVFVTYVFKKLRRRKEEKARIEAREARKARKKAASVPTTADKT